MLGHLPTEGQKLAPLQFLIIFTQNGSLSSSMAHHATEIHFEQSLRGMNFNVVLYARRSVPQEFLPGIS